MLELVLIALLIPLVLIASLLIVSAIWVEGRGPVFFTQWRAGRAGEPFRLIKFRSMTRDGQVTRVGRVLRPLHIDELPQLLHVVCGQMSLIGPRPVPLDLYHGYRERIADYDARHLIRPGLLGKAQVVLGYTDDLAGERRKCLLDLEYIREVGWRVDGQIVLAGLHLPGTGLRDSRPSTSAEDPVTA